MGKITNKTIYLPEAKKIRTANEELHDKKRGVRNNNRKTQEGFRSNLIEVIPKNQ